MRRLLSLLSIFFVLVSILTAAGPFSFNKFLDRLLV